MNKTIKGNPSKSKQTQSLPTEKEVVRGIPNFIGVRHVGLPAKDPATLAGFYRDVMGMKVIRQTPSGHGLGSTAFLGCHPEEEDHDVVLVSDATAAHTAFRVASLGDLLAFYRRIKEHGIPIKRSLNHAVTLAFYFEDPEGHLLEVFWATGLSISDAYAEPINLELPEEQLRAEIDRLAAHLVVQALGSHAPPSAQ
jgi:catechol 2,3-dioxygenase-like lactoylglutathione lyase family enzyme